MWYCESFISFGNTVDGFAQADAKYASLIVLFSPGNASD